MHHATSRVAAALLLAAASLPAMAQYDSVGLYMFGHVGQSSIDLGSERRALDQFLVDAGATNLSSSLDDEDTAYKLGLGLQLNRYFALEGTWVDLGEFSYKGVANEGSLKLDLESSGFGGHLVGRLPFDYGLSVYAKAGWHALKTKVSAKGIAAGGGSASASDDDTESVGSWAVGAAWQFAPQFSVVGEFERYRDVGSDDLSGGDADVDFWSLGLRYDLL
ncbi:Opacity protein [Geopseudomonas sagittaria]|uniref:Opacity protein n=1 Tax=Geopseudomonas sagittaria TaxID=1135990 RepID=A0A1I5VBI7_9GAMM|nr:outer membrane beta-barrel protein [Pseudomonas sagittaria]SFQ04820.1 Opacity protein [Pseudomonas sagittaria]